MLGLAHQNVRSVAFNRVGGDDQRNYAARYERCRRRIVAFRDNSIEAGLPKILTMISLVMR
jgi:hypothetical protein